jgi:hypothetical protein
VWRRQGLGAENSSTRLIHQSKVKVLKMLVVVCVLFTLSWLPLYALNFWAAVTAQQDMPKSTQHVLDEVVRPLIQWLSSSNCCMNSIVYCFFSKKFRQGFHELVTYCPHFRRLGRGPYPQPWRCCGRNLCDDGVNSFGGDDDSVNGTRLNSATSRVHFNRSGHWDYAATRTTIIRNGSSKINGEAVSATVSL